ncbi:hypothetical protein BD309DRAFT_54903 [Dichomitus squalens]|nr:hypothetical protein BD309DRAFT_54903 [Dichomitus squalens]
MSLDLMAVPTCSPERRHRTLPNGRISNYWALSCSAAYIYEYLLTLDREIELFWGRKALVSVLFLLNRYLQLFCIVKQSIAIDTSIYGDSPRYDVQSLDSSLCSYCAFVEMPAACKSMATYRMPSFSRTLLSGPWSLEYEPL